MQQSLSQDPIGLAGGVNGYVYASNLPALKADALGLIDIYVGGFGDANSGIVKNYAAKQSNSVYFEYWQKRDILKFIETQPPDEPINLIGHSYGGDTAAWVALESCKPINSLTTIDPVSRFKPDYNKVKEKAGNWINVNADPSISNRSDTIAQIGGKWGNGPDGLADEFYTVKTNHENFPGMMYAIK